MSHTAHETAWQHREMHGSRRGGDASLVKKRVGVDFWAKPVKINLFDLSDLAVARMVHSWNLPVIVGYSDVSEGCLSNCSNQRIIVAVPDFEKSDHIVSNPACNSFSCKTRKPINRIGMSPLKLPVSVLSQFRKKQT